jgi:hypothetical protein
MIPSIGRIVHYCLSEQDATQINKRRADAAAHMEEHRENSTGVAVHVGNNVVAGQVFPLVITRAWGAAEGSAVNGQVLLDGTDTLWVTSVSEGAGERHWIAPPRVSA